MNISFDLVVRAGYDKFKESIPINYISSVINGKDKSFID